MDVLFTLETSWFCILVSTGIIFNCFHLLFILCHFSNPWLSFTCLYVLFFHDFHAAALYHMALSISTHIKHAWFQLVWHYSYFKLLLSFQGCPLFDLVMLSILHYTEELYNQQVLYLCHSLFQMAQCYSIGRSTYLLLASSDMLYYIHAF